MAAFQNFRTAFHGFNREDVVHYLEYINNKHTSHVNQLKNDLQNQSEELTALREKIAQQSALTEELEQLRQEKAALEASLEEQKALVQQLEATPAELEETKRQLAEAKAAAAAAQTNCELEAYRRAERAERLAKERADRLYDQVNAALAEATACADETAAQVGAVADRIASQLTQIQLGLTDSKNKLKDTAASMYAIRPLRKDD